MQGRTEADSQLGEGENWRARLEELFPFRFNTIEVHDGTVRFLAPGIHTKTPSRRATSRQHLPISPTCWKRGKETFADFRVTASVLDGAPATVAGSVNAFAAQPTFDVNLEVKKVELPQVESLAARIHQGRCRSRQVRALHGARGGRRKIHRLCEAQSCRTWTSIDLAKPSRARSNASGKDFWIFAANVLENQDADQVAARIPFSGTIKNPKTSLFATIASVMRNAFVSAFARSLEGSITLRDVKKNLDKLDPNEAPEHDKDKKNRTRSQHGR